MQFAQVLNIFSIESLGNNKKGPFQILMNLQKKGNINLKFISFFLGLPFFQTQS